MSRTGLPPASPCQVHCPSSTHLPQPNTAKPPVTWLPPPHLTAAHLESTVFTLAPSSAHYDAARPLQGHPTNGSHPPHSYAYKHTVFTLAPRLCALRRRQATAPPSATWLPPPYLNPPHTTVN